MKRYIVTEEEMLARDRAAMDLVAATIPGTAMSFMEANMDLEEARELTRIREVPESATHFSCIISGIEMFAPKEIPT